MDISEKIWNNLGNIGERIGIFLDKYGKKGN